jgi:hypothetical protein
MEDEELLALVKATTSQIAGKLMPYVEISSCSLAILYVVSLSIGLVPAEHILSTVFLISAIS